MKGSTVANGNYLHLVNLCMAMIGDIFRLVGSFWTGTIIDYWRTRDSKLV